MRSRLGGLVAVLVLLSALGVPAGVPVAAARTASPATASTTPSGAVTLPAAWPFDHLEIGFADAPDGAAALRASAPFGLRYQYLAGGVNTGNGWSTWNTNGDFVKWYVEDSVANGVVPVFPYYQLLQSGPATGSSESAKDLNNLKNTSTMAAYWADVRLFMQKAEAGASGHPVVLHVEPDLWGYIEQAATGDDASTVPAAVASSGDADLAGYANNARGFAKAFLHLRDLYAPHVLVAYHVSVWGTMFDLHVSQTSDAQTDDLAAKSAAFYQSLGTDFDLSFVDLSDRDAGFYADQYGDGGASWWNLSDFPRYGRFIGGFSSATGEPMVVWQIPMGNTMMRATNDTWGHYADNRPQWFLDDVSNGHLASWRDWGVVALLFGGGAGGTTCACDALGDGVTNPAPSGTHVRASLSADDDGGYLRDRVAAYYASGGLSLVPGSGSPPAVDPPPPPPAPTTFGTAAAAKPTTVSRGHDVLLTARVKPSRTTRVIVDLEVYAPNGKRVAQKAWTATLQAGVVRGLTYTWHVAATRAKGTYTVKVGVFSLGWASMLRWNDRATTFRVR